MKKLIPSPSFLIISICLSLFACSGKKEQDKKAESSPNFLVLMSDNHYFSHLGCYGDPVVKTPNIDKIASEGIRFTHAFCASPSCTPARGAMLAGQDIWRLGEGGNLHSTLADSIAIYTDVLEEAGYHVGHDRKGWGPGKYEAGGRSRNPAGYSFKSFQEFMDANTQKKSWSFWLSSRNPHRPFKHGAGIASGMDPSQIEVPPYLPDVPEVRADIADYYFQIQQFDQEVAEAIAILKQNDELKNTVIIICGDNGWMMPRGLANLYDFGSRVPLIISWPKAFQGNRQVDDFVSLNDLAPSILEIAGLGIPEQMTAKSLLPILTSTKEGQIKAENNFIVTGRERHALCRQDGLGYPGRAIRTADFLYIKNYEPDRWPAGDPPLFGDIDLHMLQDKSPTKEFLMEHKSDEKYQPLYDLAFLKRPAEELFDLKKDPFQMKNVANDPAYGQIKSQLFSRMSNYLSETRDPRAIGGEVAWDSYLYRKEKDWIGTPRKEAQEKFGLKETYPYR